MDAFDAHHGTPDTGPIAPQDYKAYCRAESTRRAYQRDWRYFCQWCNSHGHGFLPATPATVALYLTESAELYRPITLGRRLAAISVAHQTAGFASPIGDIVVRDTLAGIRRVHGVGQTKKAPIRAASLRRAVESLPDDLRGLRDKALLLVGYIGALRRSELVALRVENIQFVEQGVRITVRRSKSDQEGRGAIMGIGCGAHASTCPVRALRAWLDAADITAGPVFRPISRGGTVGQEPLCGRTVALLIKGLADNLGLDPKTISGHSLRAGFITDQYSAGTAEALIMERSRHKSHFVMAGYRREADVFSFNYAAKAGL